MLSKPTFPSERKTMNQAAKDAITGMLNCFPQTNQDYRVLLLTLAKLLDGLTDRAIIESAQRFASGDVPDQSMTFAPSAPEFVAECRKRQDILDAMARPRLPAPEYRPKSSMPPFMISQQKLLNANAHLPVLFEGIDYGTWCKLSKEKQVPVGAKWVAALGIVYGPEPQAKSKVA